VSRRALQRCVARRAACPGSEPRRVNRRFSSTLPVQRQFDRCRSHRRLLRDDRSQGALQDDLIALAAAPRCHPLSIPPDGRLLYHAAAHYAAGFALCILAENVNLWRKLGFDENDALRALSPTMAGTLETARDREFANALAGPVSRGDVGVVEKQLSLMEQLGGDRAALFGLMSRRAVARPRDAARRHRRDRRGRRAVA
jgi:predicted short-subunit dehydrogenase-like oxidoreductase (DUF2520 family)